MWWDAWCEGIPLPLDTAPLTRTCHWDVLEWYRSGLHGSLKVSNHPFAASCSVSCEKYFVKFHRNRLNSLQTHPCADKHAVMIIVCLIKTSHSMFSGCDVYWSGFKYFWFLRLVLSQKIVHISDSDVSRNHFIYGYSAATAWTPTMYLGMVQK